MKMELFPKKGKLLPKARQADTLSFKFRMELLIEMFNFRNLEAQSFFTLWILKEETGLTKIIGVSGSTREGHSNQKIYGKEGLWKKKLEDNQPTVLDITGHLGLI